MTLCTHYHTTIFIVFKTILVRYFATFMLLIGWLSLSRRLHSTTSDASQILMALSIDWLILLLYVIRRAFVTIFYITPIFWLMLLPLLVNSFMLSIRSVSLHAWLWYNVCRPPQTIQTEAWCVVTVLLIFLPESTKLRTGQHY